MKDTPVDVPPRVAFAKARAAAARFSMSCADRTGALLRTLVASKPGGRVLELGTGVGVGACWLLDGMTADARLATVETNAEHAAVAKQAIAGDDRAELVIADAAEWLAQYRGPPFDLVFVDCRPGKFTHRHLLWPHLAIGGLYVGDDLDPQPTWPADHQPRVDAFLTEIAGEPQLVITLMAWSSGLVVASRRAAT